MNRTVYPIGYRTSEPVREPELYSNQNPPAGGFNPLIDIGYEAGTVRRDPDDGGGGCQGGLGELRDAPAVVGDHPASPRGL